MESEAKIAFETYYRIRTAYFELDLQPEYRIKKTHNKGWIRADLAIPSLLILIEFKDHLQLDKREIDQRREYQALNQCHGWRIIYCHSIGDIPSVLSQIRDRIEELTTEGSK